MATILSTREASEYLIERGIKLGVQGVTNYARNHVFQNAIKVNGEWQIPLESIEAHVRKVYSQSTHNNPYYLFPSQAARIIGVGESKIRQLCKYGYFEDAYRSYDTRSWQIPYYAVEQFLQRHKKFHSLPTIWRRISYATAKTKIKATITTLIAILGLMFAMISAGADLGGARRQLIEWGVFRAFPPASENEYLVVILNFHYTEGVAVTNAHQEIYQSIVTMASEIGAENVRIEIEPRSLQANDIEGARKVLNEYNAGMVIWGEDTGIRVTVNYVFKDHLPIMPDYGTITETARTQLANSTLYSSFIINELPTHLAFLAFFTNGQIAYRMGDDPKAIQLLEQAVNSLDLENEPLEGISTVYFQLSYYYATGYWENQETGEGYFREHQNEPSEYLSPTLSPELEAKLAEQGFAPVYITKEDLRKAYAYITLVIESAPNRVTESGIAYFNRAAFATGLGELEQALADYYEFFNRVSSPPDYKVTFEPYFFRGLQRAMYDDLIGAAEDMYKIDEFNIKLACDAFDWYYHILSQRAMLATNEEEYEIAMEDYSRIIKHSEGEQCKDLTNVMYYPEVFYNRGVTEFSFGDFDNALSDLNSYIQYDPTNRERNYKAELHIAAIMNKEGCSILRSEDSNGVPYSVLCNVDPTDQSKYDCQLSIDHNSILCEVEPTDQ